MPWNPQHPDYVTESWAQSLYDTLLQRLASLRDQEGWWLALPGSIDVWWRQRSKMTLEREGSGWRIVGEGAVRAKVGYAYLEDGRVRYEIATGK
mgnify:CR=1 FL=1